MRSRDLSPSVSSGDQSPLRSLTTAHTPGPWSLTEDFDTIGGRDHRVYSVSGFISPGVKLCGLARLPADHGDAELEANARLIAAAPDLLEVAKRFTIYLVEEDDRVYLRVGGATIATARHDSELGMALLHLEAAQRDAIAKAEGSQP